MPQTLHFVQILWARYPFDLINKIRGRVGARRRSIRNFYRRPSPSMLPPRYWRRSGSIESGWTELERAMQAQQAADAAAGLTPETHSPS